MILCSLAAGIIKSATTSFNFLTNIFIVGVFVESKIKLTARKSRIALRLELRKGPDPLWENEKLAATFFLMRLLLLVKLNNCVGGSQD